MWCDLNLLNGRLDISDAVNSVLEMDVARIRKLKLLEQDPRQNC